MNRDEEIVKVRFAIRGLEIAAENEMIKERSEAFKYGMKILWDYLKYIMNLDDRPYTSAELSP